MTSIPLKNSTVPWTVAQFERYRPHMTGWVTSTIIPLLDDLNCRLIVVRAPVKSGKREMVEYIAMRDGGIAQPRVHAFLSAWHRDADKDQRNELKLHNMEVFSINKKAAAEKCIQWIREQIALGKIVVIHLDECDHGSGDTQILSKVYTSVRELHKVFTILYSATPQEVLFSEDVKSEEEGEMLDDMVYGACVDYTPPAGYCGAGRFLDENLVENARPFFTLVPVPALTDQGRAIIQGLKASTAENKGRNIAILRLTKKEGRTKNDKEIYTFLRNSHRIPELQGVRIWVDKGDCEWGSPRKIEWSDGKYWEEITKYIPILIVIDQRSSRSTEWACHDRIFATHDYRTVQQYAILSQAQERVNHYDNKYAGGFQPIRVYGHKKTFELSAGRITYEQYLLCEWKMRKVDTRRAARDNLGEVYEIKNEAGVIHPQYPQPLLKVEAENVLKELGCFGDLSLSSRVSGTIRRLPIFDTYWFPCNATTFHQSFAAAKNIVGNDFFHAYNAENPFNHTSRPATSLDGREYGFLREWGILDYEKDIQTQPGWAVSIGAPRTTICYRGDVLGVALRWHTGTFCNKNRLNAYRSMYPGRNVS